MMAGDTGEGRLIGRGRELRVLRGIADDLVQGRGGSIAVVGPRGVGKSALLRDAMQDARRLLSADWGAAVSWVTAAEVERDWPYAGLHLVLSSVLSSWPWDSRATMQPLVQEFLATLDESTSSYDVAVRLQALRPPDQPMTMVFIDDAHLLDDRSQAVLGFLARRLRSMPAVLVFAADQASAHAGVVDGLRMLRLFELADDEAVELVMSAYGDVAGQVAGSIVARIGGNPRALLDVAGRVPANQRCGHAALDQYLQSSPEVQELIMPELGRLGDRQRHALLVAAISEDGQLEPVLAALAQEDPRVVRWLTQGYLDVAEDTFRLRQPAVAAIVWRESGVAERAAAYAAMAAAYAELHPDQALWHQAHASLAHDDELAADMYRLSVQLRRHGKVVRAATAAREAARLTWKALDNVDRLVWSGKLALLLGHYDDAVEAAFTGAPLASTADQRGEIALLEVRARVARSGRVPATLLATLPDTLAGHDPERSAQVHLECARVFADRMALTDARHKLRAVAGDLSGLTERTRSDYRQLETWVAVLAGQPVGEDEIAWSGAASPADIDDAHSWLRHAMIAAHLERFADARDMLSAVREAPWFAESLPVVAQTYAVSTLVELRSGRLDVALRAAAAWRHAVGGRRTDGSLVPFLAVRLYALTGDEDAARLAYSRAEELAAERDDPHSWALLWAEGGAMHLHFHELDDALAMLERARAYAVGFDDPSLLATEPDFIEVCVRRGDLESARSAYARFESRVERVPSMWGRHTAARCRALVADADAAVQLFEAAAQMDSEDVSPVELARTQFCRGELLRRVGSRSEASELMHRAAQLADDAGAHGLAVRAGRSRSGGLRAMPGSTDHPGLEALTDAERKVARLVAAGRRNREIAAELYVSVRTVETHLGRIFRKLNVRSRVELASVIVAADVTSDVAHRD